MKLKGGRLHVPEYSRHGREGIHQDGESMVVGICVTGHILCTVRKPREMNAGTLFIFSFQKMPPKFRVCLPTSVNPV